MTAQRWTTEDIETHRRHRAPKLIKSRTTHFARAENKATSRRVRPRARRAVSERKYDSLRRPIARGAAGVTRVSPRRNVEITARRLICDFRNVTARRQTELSTLLTCRRLVVFPGLVARGCDVRAKTRHINNYRPLQWSCKAIGRLCVCVCV